VTYAIFSVVRPSTPLTVLAPLKDQELAAYQENSELISLAEIALSEQFQHDVHFQMFIKSRQLTEVQMLAAAEEN